MGRGLPENCGYVPNNSHANELAEESYNSYASSMRDLRADLNKSAFPYRALAEVLKENPKYVRSKSLLAFSQSSHGSCFVAGTMVSMADGTEKAIEKVQAGDEVLSHTGRPRKVLDTFSRDYEGVLVKAKARGWAFPVESTADHKFIYFPGLPYGSRAGFGDPQHDVDKMAWQEVGKLRERDRVLFSAPNTKEEDCFFVVDGEKHLIDEELGWLLGLYIAEGSCEFWRKKYASRMTLTMHVDETPELERAAEIIKRRFGLNPKVFSYESRPNTAKLRVCGARFVEALMRYIPGTSLTKSVPAGILNSPIAVRRSFLDGWYTGDGYARSRKGCPEVSVVSASESLVRGMWRLATSLGMDCRIGLRKARKQSKVSYSLSFYGESAYEMEPQLASDSINRERSVATVNRSHVEYGLALPLQTIEKRTAKTKVYCIEVEEEHSFLANGYAVHNCVGCGESHKVAVTLAAGKWMRGEDINWPLNEKELPVMPSRSWIYGASRQVVNRLGRWEGSNGSAAAKAIEEMGILFEKKYAAVDLSDYSTSDCDRWELKGVPRSSLEPASMQTLGGRFRITDWEQMATCLHNGYASNICQCYEPIRKTRGEYGAIKLGSPWAHSQASWAYLCYKLKPRKYWRGFVIYNSHGNIYKGSKGAQTPDMPGGAYACTVDEMQRIIDNGDTWVSFDREGLRPIAKGYRRIAKQKGAEYALSI